MITLKILMAIPMSLNMSTAAVRACVISSVSDICGTSLSSGLVSALDPSANVGTHFAILTNRTTV